MMKFRNLKLKIMVQLGTKDYVNDSMKVHRLSLHSKKIRVQFSDEHFFGQKGSKYFKDSFQKSKNSKISFKITFRMSLKQ